MSEERRTFLKMALGAGIVGVGTLMGAGSGMAGDKKTGVSEWNGVVSGHSPKKEILYKKTEAWEIYYKSAY